MTASRRILGCAAALAAALLGFAVWTVFAAREPLLGEARREGGPAIESVALAAWDQRAVVELSAASVLALTVLGLGLLVDRAFRRRARAVADARAAVQRLERDKAMLTAVLNALPDGIILADAERRMAFWNDRLFDVLDIEPGSIHDGARPPAVLQDALAVCDDEALVDSDRTRAAIAEIRLASGKWVERRMSAVRGVGDVAIYRDIVDRKRRELEMEDGQQRLHAQTSELVQLAADLDVARRMAEAARVEAETASRTKSNFIAGMNHELRTPLNAILGFAQVIHELRFGSEDLERYSEYAGHIVASGEHLLSLINDLLDLAKIEAGKMDLQPQCLDVKQLLAATMVMVEPVAARGGITVELLAPDEPVMMPCDPLRLKQCFLNLITNAVKFTPEGGKVAVRVVALGDRIEIAVADTGIGVKSGDIAKIFEPFGQIDSPLARRHIGTGLGLPLARSLVQLHGGQLEFDSVEGAGTTVTVTLPRHRLVA